MSVIIKCSNNYQFTREGVEQLEEAVRERNSVGDMTKLELGIEKSPW